MSTDPRHRASPAQPSTAVTTRVARIAFGPGRTADTTHLGDILRSETVGGMVMLGATVLALAVANLFPEGYQHLVHLQLGRLTVHEWAADGLLTIFFFVAGMELKRELTEGSLSRPADALLPIVAALGGMLLPAGIYLLTNQLGGGDPRGWAIPMATDIAFALAVLAIVGSHLPSGLRAFLLTLAIVDDLGAILVIATVFSHGLHLASLALALASVAAFWAAQRARLDVRLPGGALLFVALGVAGWWFMLASGVHATIAGVAMGLATRTSEDELDDPIDRWQHRIEPWSAGLVVPVFAFTSAGLTLGGHMARVLVTSPVALGVALGLLCGKFLGVFTAARLTARFTSAELAPGVSWRDVAAVSLLCGVGFTVSLLITDLAFPGEAELGEAGKAAVLLASTIAAVAGGFALRHRNNRHAELNAQS